MSRKVVLAGGCRTAIGVMGGALSTVPAADLGTIVIKEALNRAGVKPEMVDEVYMGCVIQAGLGQNVARQASIKAGLPIEVPAVTMNVVCGSGLNCVNQAAQMIMAGDADVVVAGGMENMSMAPYAAMNARFGYRMNNGKLVDTMVNDALWDAFNDYHMITTADNICREWGLTREELDEFALKSQLKAEEAQKTGAFEKEIVPVMVKKKKEMIEFKVDEGPRHGSTIEGLAKLRTINPDGFVTAGNASGINDDRLVEQSLNTLKTACQNGFLVFTIKQRLIVAIGKPPCFYNEKKISRRRWRKASVSGDFAYGKQRCWKIQGGQCCNRPVAVPFLSNFALTREQCSDKIIHELRYRSSVEGDFKWIIKHNIIRSW